MSFSKFWTEKLVKIYIIIVFIISILSCIPTYLETPEDVVKLTNISNYQATQRLILSADIVFCDVFSIILTGLTIYRIRHFATSHEKKLIIVTASHTVIAIVVFLYQVTKTLNLKDPISLFLAKYRTILAYIFICTNFGTILIADSRIRMDFLAIFGKKKTEPMFIVRSTTNN
ncbi:unnamed protein product [Caenorhabditis angaria]|uniref:Serpentine receptor class gamma n=1 Tax=Caenorhabditis angaria TaxID=860376 RepID=A0A9P1IF07_9PELO|nr:unnamed protein product [Caenorhabditis angaria]